MPALMPTTMPGTPPAAAMRASPAACTSVNRIDSMDEPMTWKSAPWSSTAVFHPLVPP